MNKDKILAVADAIEQHAIAKLGFSMLTYFDGLETGGRSASSVDKSGHECGTVACIAGWACALDVGLSEAAGIRSPFMHARTILGLDERQATLLFIPDPLNFDAITPADAAKVLRTLAETGDVDWSEVAARQGEEDPRAIWTRVCEGVV